MKQAKINMEQANQLLNLLKVAAVVVEDSEEMPSDKDVNVQDLIKGIEEPNEDFIREKLRAEIEDSIKTKNTGKWINSLRSKVAQTFGLKTAELSDLSLEDILALAKNSTKVNVDKAQQDWLNDREKLNSEHENELEKLRGDYERRLRDSHEQYVRRDKKDRFISILQNMPRVGGDINMQAEALLAAIERQYVTKFDETKGRVNVFTKEEEPSPIFRGKKIYSDEDFADEFAQSMGWKRTDNRGVPPKEENKETPKFNQNSSKVNIPDNVPEHVKRTLARIGQELEQEEQ